MESTVQIVHMQTNPVSHDTGYKIWLDTIST
jgi:hypothetical protein